MNTATSPTKRWPAWAGRWYGILLRVLVATWGILAGLFGVAAGYFTAVDWKTGESNWTAGAVLFIVGGLIVALYSIYGAIRPTKLSFIPPATMFFITGILTLIGFVQDAIRTS